MKLTFTKRRGKFDDVLIVRDDGSSEVVKNPKQRIIPHDMVHFAVEQVVTREGFLSKVAKGQVAGSRMEPDDEAEAIERLVETMQAEAWSDSGACDEVIATYQHACDARSHAYFPVTARQIDMIRHEIDRLTELWEAVPMDGSLSLVLDQLA